MQKQDPILPPGPRLLEQQTVYTVIFLALAHEASWSGGARPGTFTPPKIRAPLLCLCRAQVKAQKPDCGVDGWGGFRR